MTAAQYQPGKCNIGGPEVRHRKAAGWLGLTLAVGLWAAFEQFDTVPAARLIIFFPAFLTALGFLQARRRFCVAYGLAGSYNVSSAAPHTSRIENPDDRLKDRKFSIQLLTQSFLIALLAALLCYLT